MFSGSPLRRGKYDGKTNYTLDLPKSLDVVSRPFNTKQLATPYPSYASGRYLHQPTILEPRILAGPPRTRKPENIQTIAALVSHPSQPLNANPPTHLNVITTCSRILSTHRSGT